MRDNGIVLTARQQALVDMPLDRKIWLEGSAGCGKTTVGIGRLLRLLERGIPAESILIFVPQRSLARPYIQALRAQADFRGGEVSVHTIGSLAKQIGRDLLVLGRRARRFRPRE